MNTKSYRGDTTVDGKSNMYTQFFKTFDECEFLTKFLFIYFFQLLMPFLTKMAII